MSKIKGVNNPQENIMSIREWVKFRLHLKGYTLKSFGQLHGVKAGTVGVVFYRPYPKMEKLLAEFLEIPVWDLWPGRYTNQKPNRTNTWYLRGCGGWHRKSKNITVEDEVNEKKGDADQCG